MVDRGFHPTSRDEVVERALGQRGLGRYELGGGAVYTARTYFDATGNQHPDHGDCSGLLAFAAKYRRGPWNTDAMVDDAIERTHLVPTGKLGKQRRFRLVLRDEEVLPGDFIVKPGPDFDHNGRRDRPGHCGIVTGIEPGFVRGTAGWWEHVRVTHCSGALQERIDPSTGKRYGAVRTTDASLWALSGYFIRPKHLT